MSNAGKLRFYIDHAIMTRDYAALAAFEDRLSILEEPRGKQTIERRDDPPLSKAPVWAPDEFSNG